MKQIKIGAFVLYNGVNYVIDDLEVENGKIVGMWCLDESGGESFLLPGHVDFI